MNMELWNQDRYYPVMASIYIDRIKPGELSQADLVHHLSLIIPKHAILHTDEDTRPYECDGLSAYRSKPWVVALPETTEQVQAIMRICSAYQIPVIARGAGTGLSGGALPRDNCLLLSLAKFNKILNIDPDNATAHVQTGVRNLAITQAANEYGLYYAPDPSSQIACSIGGNVAENSGGACLPDSICFPI